MPAALFGVGTVAGAVGSGLGAMGARDLVAAHERQAAAKQQYESRAAVSEDLREVANQRLIDFSALQREAFTGVVQRMVVWLRSHAKQVRESDRLLVDGLEVSLSLMPPTVGREEAVAGWLTGASNTALAGLGTAGAVTTAVEKYGVAGTGSKVSDLAGAAKQKAAAAFRGGGPLKNGGGGIALGNLATKTAVGGITLLAAGSTCKVQGIKALTRAEEFATHIQVACAEMDLQDAKLRAVVQRADELTDVLTRLERQATVAMDRLEALTFDPTEHMAALSETIELVRGVQGVAQARLINERGDLSEQSEILRVRYREMNEDNSDG
ncbi:hypothetical protein MM440_06705 [Arsenicicoccus piscis]|uniref:hypothetical protein n=1 Tax=Arsenicicoccus piscis TaxID=673954 RepID=UPI001F4D2079|nr:hypothetical protein [Arsenicicoccus piscis]MCH8627481.1 hypothetical protein [Arsenicicoccus piscis]